MKKMRDFMARLVIYDLPEMTPKEIERLTKWLWQLREDILFNNKPKEYSHHFTARLMK